MITEFEKKAYDDLIAHYWNPSRGNFSFSKNEKVSSPSITTACIMAIKGYGAEGEKWIKKNRGKIKDYYLTDYPWMDAGKHYQNVMAMSFGLIGLDILEAQNKKIKLECINFLKEQQNEDGGWSFTKMYSENSHPYFTYWALKALIANEIVDETWENHILPALEYCLGTIRSHATHPTTYLMIRHIIKIIQESFHVFIDEKLEKRIKNIPIYKIERHQYQTGAWKPEPAVINSAYFRKSIFSLKNMYFLSQLDERLVSDKYQKMLNWIEKNYLNPGWPSDSEASSIGVSWTTAYILMGLTSYKNALKLYLED